MSPHADHLAEWIDQIGDVGLRFCQVMDPMDAILLSLLARNIERACGDYLSKFNLMDVVDPAAAIERRSKA